MKHPRLVVLVLLPLVCGVEWSCDQTPAGWTPVLEETSTAFLESEMERLLEHVRVASDALESNPAQAADALAQAQGSLERLSFYYLPLFQARERAYNALRSLFLGDEARVKAELEQIEGILIHLAESAEGAEFQELKSLAETVADARLAVEAGPEEAQTPLELLARRLNQAALKGDLILNR